VWGEGGSYPDQVPQLFRAVICEIRFKNPGMFHCPNKISGGEIIT